MHARNHRLSAPFDGGDRVLQGKNVSPELLAGAAAVAGGVVGGDGGEGGEVDAGAEVVAGAGEDDDVDLGVEVERVEGVGEFGEEVGGEGVAVGRAVEVEVDDGGGWVWV